MDAQGQQHRQRWQSQQLSIDEFAVNRASQTPEHFQQIQRLCIRMICFSAGHVEPSEWQRCTGHLIFISTKELYN